MQVCIRFLLFLGVRDPWKHIYRFYIWTLWPYCGWKDNNHSAGKLAQWHICNGGSFSVCCSSSSHNYSRRVSGWCSTRHSPLIPLPQQPRVFPLLQKCPWHIHVHIFMWISMALWQQLFLWIGLRLKADLHGWGLTAFAFPSSKK